MQTHIKDVILLCARLQRAGGTCDSHHSQTKVNNATATTKTSKKEKEGRHSRGPKKEWNQGRVQRGKDLIQR